MQVSTHIAHTLLLLFTQGDNPIPMPFSDSFDFLSQYYLRELQLVCRTQANLDRRTVCLCAIGGTAILLVLELGQPFSGLMQISN
jgi:hypothetical protein